MRLLIGDDHEMISAGIIASFRAKGRTEEFKTAKSKTELLTHLKNETFDVLILDVQFGDDDARQIVKEIDKMQIELKKIALSSHEDELTVKSVLASGFNSYVSKGAPIEELIDAVDSVAKDEQYISVALKKKLFTSLFTMDAFSTEIRLTKREKEVLSQIQDGDSSKVIANRLNLSEKTIETYRSSLFLKFQVKNVASLVKESIIKGFIFN